jgi:hypothetical protein
VSYKSDPMFRCSISMENESFLERFRCTAIQPLRLFINVLYPFSNNLNDLRNKLGIERVFMATSRLAQTSFVFVDTFFGFEVK